MKLRIAHVTATFPPYRGGTGNVCYHNARELALRGHDVHVFTAATTGAIAREMRDGFTIHRLRPLVQIGNAPVLPDLLSRLRDFDLIHLHYPFILGAELVRLAALMDRTPVVMSFHNDLIGDGARARIFALYQQLSAYLMVRRVARLCAVSLDHYQSSQLAHVLANRAPQVVELPNGVDLTRFYPNGSTRSVRERYGIPDNARLVLFVAALDRAHHFKGLERLLLAAQALPPNVWLLVVGDGDMRQEYEQQAIQLGIAARVKFVGAIDHEHTPPFFRSADLTVLPSSPPESFGLVLIESLACGTPVVASNIAGVRTVVDHEWNGLLVDPHTPVALPTAMQQLLDDPELRRMMAQRGRAKVEATYNWERIGTRLETIYAEVLAPFTLRRSFYARGEQ